MRRSMVAAALAAPVLLAAGWTEPAHGFEPRTLDGSNNNRSHPSWGRAGTNYVRVAPANYADGVGQVQAGPDLRYLSNRVFNDRGQNIFSERDVSQWGWAWGQFMDHDFGLRDETPGEGPAIPFSASDPLETFRNDLGAIDFTRTRPAPGTGSGGVARQHVNTISSYIDASNVYGVDAGRLDWLRDGPLDGNPLNNQATLLMPRGFLPRRDARGNAAAAPAVDLMGPLQGQPATAAVAGDVRANENIALTAIHTLFAREHNRIVGLLRKRAPRLSEETRFQIARRVVGAELQYITYNEFLPAIGVNLAPYRGYRPGTNAELSEEFAVVGYRAHSMIHGEFEPVVPANRYTPEQREALERNGARIEDNADGTLTIVIPLSAAFGNPDLLELVGEREVLESLGEHQYRNDEQFDNALRSVLFQIPRPGVDPSTCGSPVIDEDCFTGVSDLAALDIARQRDHGIPFYNDLRRAYGLGPRRAFTAITGESTDQLPDGLTIDSPGILDFVQLRGRDGRAIPLDDEDAEEGAVVGTRRSTLAARLRALYGGVNGNLDAFVGMVSEPHVAGSELGELQRAIWKRQFEAVRDGDRFFYLNDPALIEIRVLFGIDYRRTLARIIRDDVPGAAVADHVFKAV